LVGVIPHPCPLSWPGEGNMLIMKFSTRTTYGLRAMIQLADNFDNGNVSTATIAQEEGISSGYLERLMASLKKAKLVGAEKGASGGYSLSKKPKDITVLEIVRALEGKLAPFHCLDENGKFYCNEHCNCGANRVLVRVQDAVKDTLGSMTLKDLVR
jgi:Rrf2 family protein